ncbi:hypothetical protein LJR029_000882 [Caballeronia sp. LjRoot29]|uniref:hypothetical protein n=1 Tax=Caballeronia sp. LjRoot29 TaxID=3342315 RepID=UPI003ECDE06D
MTNGRGGFVNEKVRHLLARISALEDELKTTLHDREIPLFYHVNGKRIEFDASVSAAHRASRTGLFRWVLESRPSTILVAPVIYGLIVPLLIFDLGLTVYQIICFPVYKIEKVKRSDYIATDRWHLGYLNFMERFNCLYCAYANGIIAYGTEIAARTEQYWCPIKHANRVLGTHARYEKFIVYGDAVSYQQQLSEFRAALSKDSGRPKVPGESPLD